MTFSVYDRPMFVLSPALHNIFHTSMARYSQFMLKMPLNTNQPTNQPTSIMLDCADLAFVCRLISCYEFMPYYVQLDA